MDWRSALAKSTEELLCGAGTVLGDRCGGGFGCCPRRTFQSGFKARALHRAHPSSPPGLPRGNSGRPAERPMGVPGLSPSARGGKEGLHKSAGRRTPSQNKAMRRRGLVDAFRLLPSTMLLPCFLLVASSPTLLASAASESSDMAMNYLEKFGYIAPTKNGTAALRSQEALVDAVKEFQRFAGLRVTGRVDNETAATMQLPRCGVRDKVGFGLDARRRRRRYALQGSKWASNELSYRISKYPRRVKDRVAVDKEIARAFKMWSDVSPLTFTHKKTGPVNIDIQFVRGEHGDGDPFNGPGGTLAHAFFPRYGGDAHFDDEEKWTIDEYTGVNLFQVAAHEFGHSLGLSHSDVRRSLMAPFYRGFEPGFQLDRDDIDGVQALYGAVHRTTKTPSKGSRKPAQPGPDLCQDATIDAATRTEDGSSYVFKGDYYWKIETDGIADGYPRRISDDWGGLPGHIDAALTWSDGKTFFFKGGNYWRFRNKQMSKGYPQKISVGFQGIPDNLDAALVWSGNGKTYFFKGNQYWRYDSRNEVPVSDRYPQPVSNWNGVPGHLDAAFQWQNGYSYFFKGPNYYRFNDKDFGVDKGDPPYPRATSVWWFDCKAMSSAMAQQQASSRRHPESATAHVLDRTEAPMAPRIPVRQLGLQRDAAPEAPELGPVGHAEPPPPTTVAAGASTSFLTSSTAALVLLAVPLFRPLQLV